MNVSGDLVRWQCHWKSNKTKEMGNEPLQSVAVSYRDRDSLTLPDDVPGNWSRNMFYRLKVPCDPEMCQHHFLRLLSCDLGREKV